MTRNKKTIMGLALALALMAVLSLFVGAVPLAPADVLTTLFGGETSDSPIITTSSASAGAGLCPYNGHRG